MDNFDNAALAVKALCPNNEILYDDMGMPSVMVKIPKMTYAQLGMGESTDVHPAFIVDGKIADAIYISKYQNCVNNNRAYSLPGVDPKASINYDDSLTMCKNKGKGWHLMSRMEWGLMVRLMQYNGFFPDGNILYGKGADGKYHGIPAIYDTDGKILKINTGTGPLTYSHDQSPSGVMDLRGNAWEWTSGIRFFNGEVQILENNNGANNTYSHEANSPYWKAINCADGSMLTPDGEGTTPDSVKLDCRNGVPTYANSKTYITEESLGGSYGNFKCSAEVGEKAKLILQNLGLLLYTDGELFKNHYNYFRLYGERFLSSGGSFSSGSGYGAASFYGNNSRAYYGWLIGFRSAFIKI